MICVKAYFNTDADGNWVYEIEGDDEDLPVCYYGPFNSMADAISWMENDYPDDDTDLYDMIADDFDLPANCWVNHPNIVTNDTPNKENQNV